MLRLRSRPSQRRQERVEQYQAGHRHKRQPLRQGSRAAVGLGRVGLKDHDLVLAGLLQQRIVAAPLRRVLGRKDEGHVPLARLYGSGGGGGGGGGGRSTS